MSYCKYILFLLTFCLAFYSCAFGKKIKSGEMAFERKQYAVAVDMLQEEYTKADNQRKKARIAFFMGQSYTFLEENDLAVEWLEKSVDQGYGNEALSKLGKAFKKIGDYSSAIKAYELLKNSSNSNRQIDREIYVIKEVAKWEGETKEGVEIEMLGENTAFSEYAPVIFDKNYLVFTSDREESTGRENYKWTGNRHSDIYVKSKNASNIKRFDAVINSMHNEGTACFTSDGMEMVFTRCFVEGDDDGYCKLMYSEKFAGIWSEPRLLPIMKPGINYGQPTFIENDSVLVFSSKMDDGVGGHDLYYSERLPNDEGGVDWGEPYILPSTINSQGNEMFPSGDGDTLYFSSDYFAGLGGLDIFKTWLQPNGQWAPPQNLKRPINSSYDDFSFVVDYSAQLRGLEKRKGFFSSARNGYGKEDIYRFTDRHIEMPLDVNEEPVKEPIKVDLYLAGRTKELEYSDRNNPNSEKLGKLSLDECYITISDGTTEENIYSDETGQFIVSIEKDKTYSIKASKIGYLNAFENISTSNLKYKEGELSKTINVELILNKIYTNVEIRLENIYYNFNKSNIRDDAKPTLDSLSILLAQNPQIEVQLSSHTDCRGDIEYNQILSQKRAEAAVAYMATKGVDRSRMTAKGFGASRLKINCICDDCSEEDHQENRRTTFKILE